MEEKKFEKLSDRSYGEPSADGKGSTARCTIQFKEEHIMEEKKFEKLSDQELDQVSGGVHGDTDENGDGGKSILMKALSGGCIECGNPSISHGWGWINGVAAGDRRYVVLCRCCKNRFYVDDDGKIVSSILIHDGYFRP